jgi:hypothetical protein
MRKPSAVLFFSSTIFLLVIVHPLPAEADYFTLPVDSSVCSFCINGLLTFDHSSSGFVFTGPSQSVWTSYPGTTNDGDVGGVLAYHNLSYTPTSWEGNDQTESVRGQLKVTLETLNGQTYRLNFTDHRTSGPLADPTQITQTAKYTGHHSGSSVR